MTAAFAEQTASGAVRGHVPGTAASRGTNLTVGANALAGPGPASSDSIRPKEPVDKVDKLADTMIMFVDALTDKESQTSTMKWERAKPKIKAESAEGLMNEIVALDTCFAELGIKTFRKMGYLQAGS